MVAVAPGVVAWPGKFSRDAQESLLAEILARVEDAPFYRPTMPGSGKAFSAEQTNFGELGWVADKSGYRYQPHHPLTAKPWPAIPQALLDLWDEAAALFDFCGTPQCCLVNRYRGTARMGLHQDKDEAAADAPVVSLSLGDEALFRIGAVQKGGPTQSLKLASGDVVMFGGPARLAFHGIDRIRPGSSTLIPGGGRINLTLRRVT